MDELREMLEQNPELLEFHGDSALGVLSVATGELPCYATTKRIIGGKKVFVMVMEVNAPEFEGLGVAETASALTKQIQRTLKARAKAAKG